MSTQRSRSGDAVSSIISSLSRVTPPEPPDRNPFASLLSQLSKAHTKHARSLMLTLHFLFPHELLPALDLLDRKLVTCLQLRKSPPGISTNIEDSNGVLSGTFYVQSASAVTSKTSRSNKFRKTFNPSDTYYEVQLNSWNCSCPAFAYSAFVGFDVNGISDDNAMDLPEADGNVEGPGEERDEGWTFGGDLTTETSATPICKHILAVAIGRAAPNLFSDGVETKSVSSVGLAGWAAGWGE